MSPYIDSIDRAMLACTDACQRREPETPGELNYIITDECLKYLTRFNKPGYEELNEVIGVLECAKLEMYRRRVAIYEDKKKEANGDVY